MAQNDPHPPSSHSDRADPPAPRARADTATSAPATAAAGGGAPSRPAKQNPASRSFVVEVAADAAADGFSGRVQHLSTLDGGNFSSADTLVAIMRRVLDRVREDDGT